MTDFTEKPKRKNKPKLNRRRRWIVLLVLLLLAILSQMMVSVVRETVTQAVFLSEWCNMDVDYPFLHYEENNNLLMTGNLNTGLVTGIDDEVTKSGIFWFEDGKSFIYQTYDKDSDKLSTILVDYSSNEKTILDSDADEMFFAIPSSHGHYIVLMDLVPTESGFPIQIVDSQLHKVIFETIYNGVPTPWSRDDSYLVFEDAYDVLFIFDVMSKTKLDLKPFPPYIHVLGWSSDYELVYWSETQELMQYDVTTGQSSQFIEGIYPESTDHSIFNYDRITTNLFGMFDDDSQYWLIDLQKRTRERFDLIDLSRSPNMLVSIYGLLIVEYPDKHEYDIFEIHHDSHTTINLLRGGYDPVPSESGRYLYHWQNTKPHEMVVQEFRTKQVTIIDREKRIVAQEWLTINDQDYLYFSQPVVDNPYAYTHYLYNPETQSACVMMVSQARKLIWQPR